MTDIRTITINTRQGDADITIPEGFMHRSELLAQGWDDTLLTAFVPSRFTLLDGYPELGRTDRMIWPTGEVRIAELTWNEVLGPILAFNLDQKSGRVGDSRADWRRVHEVTHLNMGVRERAEVRKLEHERAADLAEFGVGGLDAMTEIGRSARMKIAEEKLFAALKEAEAWAMPAYLLCEECEILRANGEDLCPAHMPQYSETSEETGHYCEDCQEGDCLQHEEGPGVMELGFQGEQFA